jgi:hypothetical protein
MEIKVGDEVEFKGQDSYYRGKIVCIFTKRDGVSKRCVVQDSRGLLLIKGMNGVLIPEHLVDESY